MFKCENCGADAKRLICRDNFLGCNHCYVEEMQNNIGALHQRGVNKYKPKMTHAEKQHILTRRIGRDGLVHADKRWETKDF